MRIDKALAEKFGSRNKAANAIEEGFVLVNGKIVSVSYNLKKEDAVTINIPENNFVSAGGYKLDKALNDFSFDVTALTFADIGASTGGFTDCLLKRGAAKVYCIDVGESQLDKNLLSKNIVVIDNFNARELNKELFEEELDGIVIDVSFISLTYILGAIAKVLNNNKSVFALIKPQFECGAENLGKNGIVKSDKVRKQVIFKIYNYAESINLSPVQITNAPIKPNKNMEFVVHLVKHGKPVSFEQLIKSVKL